jgi:hypothetical protein
LWHYTSQTAPFMKILIPFFLIIAYVLPSCEKDNIEIDPDNLLIGVWINDGFRDDVTIYKRSDEFTNNYCYLFKSDGTLTERQNVGWCGTPPISYADYEGTWEIANDTLISITVGSWNGDRSYRLDIESVDSEALKVIILPSSE